MWWQTAGILPSFGLLHDIQQQFFWWTESDAISFAGCPYVYYNNIVNNRYIALPHNISDLNNVFCAPLNRDGLLCRDCIDGFGPSVVSTGYTCANCTGNNYGWMLYTLSEFVPATVFFFAVLTLRICITSAPMNCFVMFSQLLVITMNYISQFQGALIAELGVTSITCCVQSHSHRVWILEPGLLPVFHSTILCEPRPNEYPRSCPPVCVCFLPTAANCSYIHLCWTTWTQLQTNCLAMETISQMFC